MLVEGLNSCLGSYAGTHNGEVQFIVQLKMIGLSLESPVARDCVPTAQVLEPEAEPGANGYKAKGAYVPGQACVSH